MTASPRSDAWARGVALLRAGRGAEAEAHYRALLPGAEASLGVARSLHIRAMHAEAEAFYAAAVAGLADAVAARIDAANGKLALEKPLEALEMLEPAPPVPVVLRLRAAALGRLDRLEERLAVAGAWLAAEPGDARAHMEQASTLLALGRLPEGWAAYEHRWQVLDDAGDWHSRAQPLWRGETPLAGRSILVHAEQGFGDTIQFCRYVPLLRARGARVILQVQPELGRLLAGVADEVVAGDPPPHDCHIPLMSLPFAFGTELADIPPPLALRADAAPWRDRLAALPGRKLGVAWTGSAPAGGEAQNRRRSVPAERLAALKTEGITLISLQKDHVAPAAMIDWTGELRDFADTAGLVAALDLVISVDSSVAHLAATLGRPVWLLNRFDSCWRWLRGREDSPWYPTLRQFRQPAPGDWETPLAAVARALAE